MAVPSSAACVDAKRALAMWAVGNPIGDLEYFTGQAGIATDDLRERIGARCVAGHIENFLTGGLQGQERMGLRVEELA
jgi:hypothetical protein